MEKDRIEHHAVDVVLTLVEGAVPDPHRPRALVAGKVVAGRLGEITAAVDPVHDLQRAVLGRLEIRNELDELVGLQVQVQPVQRLQGEGGVAHPGVAVVPVALAPRSLGQRGRGRCDRRAGRHVRQALDRKRRTLDRLREVMVREAGPPDPEAPESRCCRDPRLGVIDVLWAREPFRPGEGAVRTLTRLERVSPSDTAALDSERQVGPQPERLPGAARVGRVRVAVSQCPLCLRPPVVEAGLADEVDSDLTLDTHHRSYEHVFGVIVYRRPRVRCDRVLAKIGPYRQRVSDDDPTRGCLPRRDENVGARLVRSSGGMVDAERPEPEETRLPVEHAGEDAG